jgi:RNA polymerase sigma-70 factor (ECF subfamily)
VRNNSLGSRQRRDNSYNTEQINNTEQTNNTEYSYNHDPADETQGNELKEIITRSISSMPVRRAEIFRMHRFRNLKYKEIAQLLSLSVKTVELEMSKALKTLRKEIELYHHTL